MVPTNLVCLFEDFGGMGTSVDGRMDGNASSASVVTLLLSKTEKLSSGEMSTRKLKLSYPYSKQ